MIKCSVHGCGSAGTKRVSVTLQVVTLQVRVKYKFSITPTMFISRTKERIPVCTGHWGFAPCTGETGSSEGRTAWGGTEARWDPLRRNYRAGPRKGIMKRDICMVKGCRKKGIYFRGLNIGIRWNRGNHYIVTRDVCLCPYHKKLIPGSGVMPIPLKKFIEYASGSEYLLMGNVGQPTQQGRRTL